MTQISFFHGTHNRLQAVAAWLGRECREGRQVLVYVPAEERSKELDRLLWTTPATGFTPNCNSDEGLAAETPVLLASGLDNPPHDKCLLNLSNEIPPGFSRFQQLIEIISVAEDDRLPGRERYRYYRERGYPLETRDIAEGF
jgi:DNA polymerase-3 subunit chi